VKPLDVTPLAAFVTGSPEVPAEVLDAGRLLLLDTLGALAGGLRYPPVQALGLVLGTRGDATVPYGRTVTLGAAATWLDADSGGSFHPEGMRLPPVPTAHPAPHILPVLLQEAKRQRLHDDALVLVFVLGCEVGLRFGVGTSLRPGLHPHGIHGPIGAAVTTSLLFGHDAEITARAIELAAACPLAATLAVPMGGGTVRNIWTGLGAWYGASAAVWAACGLPSSTAVLTDLQGTSVCTDLSEPVVTRRLGRRWRVLDSYLKPYACARWVHPALDALQLAVDQLPGSVRPNPDDVEGLDVATFAFAASLDGVEPTSDLHARFSVPLSLSALLHDGVLHAPSYLPDALARPSLRRLAERVQLREEPAYSAALPQERPTRVTLRLRDGRQVSAEVRNARGNPDRPLPVAEVAAKFRHNVGTVLPNDLIDEVVEALTEPAPPTGSTVSRAATALLGGLDTLPDNSRTTAP
jgi:2-methylcitrate dehydratase PrpD